MFEIGACEVRPGHEEMGPATAKTRFGRPAPRRIDIDARSRRPTARSAASPTRRLSCSGTGAASSAVSSAIRARISSGRCWSGCSKSCRPTVPTGRAARKDDRDASKETRRNDGRRPRRPVGCRRPRRPVARRRRGAGRLQGDDAEDGAHPGAGNAQACASRLPVRRLDDRFGGCRSHSRPLAGAHTVETARRKPGRGSFRTNTGGVPLIEDGSLNPGIRQIDQAFVVGAVCGSRCGSIVGGVAVSGHRAASSITIAPSRASRQYRTFLNSSHAAVDAASSTLIHSGD